MQREQYNEKLGEVISTRRKVMGWTLDQLALFMGDKPSRSSIHAIENGKQELNAYEFFKLQFLLGELPKPDFQMEVK